MIGKPSQQSSNQINCQPESNNASTSLFLENNPAPFQERPQRRTGTWDEHECRLFDLYYQKHGPKWEQIAKEMKTREKEQVRSHAQKYFNKKQKEQKQQKQMQEGKQHQMKYGSRVATRQRTGTLRTRRNQSPPIQSQPTVPKNDKKIRKQKKKQAHKRNSAQDQEKLESQIKRGQKMLQQVPQQELEQQESMRIQPNGKEILYPKPIGLTRKTKQFSYFNLLVKYFLLSGKDLSQSLIFPYQTKPSKQMKNMQLVQQTAEGSNNHSFTKSFSPFQDNESPEKKSKKIKKQQKGEQRQSERNSRQNKGNKN